MAFVWSFVLVALLNYVVGAIANVPFDFQAGVMISLVMAVLVILLGEAIPNQEVSDN
ncbi:Protein of uncharacterised function (DUF2929) [Sporosarcina pasteurii]|uniref:Protein of uncharacterized function (DUF2929) n=2 Tax=Sporosarcina pasteurii TaxID=1474 RepID=A0A380BDW4_SPOPA|nr:Protein of uncharacterised function (DUF2929) [Sporosarcina pasteurii]